MVRFKKLAAVLLSAVMLVCCFTVQASAKSVFDDAIKISATEVVSHTFKNDTEVLYKIVLPDSGTIQFYCSDYNNYWSGSTWYPRVSLLDKNGAAIIDNAGFVGIQEGTHRIDKKGTYYIKIVDNDKKAYFKNFYYGFQPDNTPTISLALNAKVGDEFDFSALASNYTGKVTYKTTDSKVATVDKGKVTCKKAGKAKIRAYMNNGDYAEITLVVKKK
ncbi:MAG: Ig-like domain-containing protein [Ruminiclostridium sp.]|nr:Ig-like domain-containing protein [Ruminiclostridium sp.]